MRGGVPLRIQNTGFYQQSSEFSWSAPNITSETSSKRQFQEWNIKSFSVSVGMLYCSSFYQGQNEGVLNDSGQALSCWSHVFSNRPCHKWDGDQSEAEIPLAGFQSESAQRTQSDYRRMGERRHRVHGKLRASHLVLQNAFPRSWYRLRIFRSLYEIGFTTSKEW